MYLMQLWLVQLPIKMAAYAALASLLNLTDRIENHPRLSTSLDNNQIKSLCKNVDFLLDFMDTNHSPGSAQVLETQIASAAYATEDVIVSHVVDQINAGCVSLLDLQTSIQDMASIKEKVINVKHETEFKDVQPSPAPTSSWTPRNTMVGFDDELIHLMERLTGRHSIPIVGMGGIGKTTLARNAYENPLILRHFDIRAWATISQEYSVEQIFVKILSFESKSTGELERETEQRLGEYIHKSLFNRRYLIVLDDVWSIEAWDKVKFFFPDNNNGSRIVITTRLSNLALHFGSSYLPMKLLDEDKSWKLFCTKAFSEEGCPPQLEQTANKIARKCKGLPLSIVVIGALLRKSSMTQDYWDYIAEDTNQIMNSGDEDESLDILALSYCHLPAHLKPCFLYTGLFSDDRDISMSKLIKLWVAEGFIRPNKTEILEEIAEGYLKDLVDRNLVFVTSLGWSGKIRGCNMHDLLKDFCLKLAQKEKFIGLMKGCDISQREVNECRIVFVREIFDKSYDYGGFLQTLEIGSDELLSKFKLFKGLNKVDKDSSLDDILKQVNSCYVCTPFLWIHGLSRELPSSISRFWNLQILTVRDSGEIVAPPEIWEMPQLRHVWFTEIYLPHPPSSVDDIVLRNLQTLKGAENLRLSEEVCKRIPNIKKLKIIYDIDQGSSYDQYCLNNIGCFRKLESINCYFCGDSLVGSLVFPDSLQELTLEGGLIHWEDLTMIGSLPRLQVLKLRPKSVRGSEWNPVEGEFVCLKLLAIYCCYDLKYWNADGSHFPVLENLILEDLSELDEIPPGIGEIPTLGHIRLNGCNDSTAISAVEILEEQESLGNEDLHVWINFWKKKELKKFKKQVQQFHSFTSNNLHLHVITLDDYF